MWRTKGAFIAAAVVIGLGAGLLLVFSSGGNSKTAPVAIGSNAPRGAVNATNVGDDCLVGTWRADQTTTQLGISSPLVGGAGTVQTISADGSVAVDYANSDAWRGDIDGNPVAFTKRGTERHKVSGSLDVYNAFAGDVSQLFVTEQLVTGQPLVVQWIWQDSARPYTCTPTTLTIENNGSDPDVYQRVPT